jgi:RNA polymerase sigma-70 factor (ECF subfamily)
VFRLKNTSKLADEEILYLYKVSGITEYFGNLYNRYVPLLYGLCLKYLQNADKARGAVRQLFEDLLFEISHYEIDNFRMWIYSVMKNHCIQLLQEESGREMIENPNQNINIEDNEFLYLLNDEDEDGGEQKKALRLCLKKLPVQQRIAIIRFFVEEMSYADIVNSTRYNLEQVKSHIREGKYNLKICMEKNNL